MKNSNQTYLLSLVLLYETAMANKQVKKIAKWVTNSQMVLIPNTNSQYGSSTEIITEESPFKPLSLYAETKCDAEKAVLDSGNGIALRLATVFGMSYNFKSRNSSKSATVRNFLIPSTPFRKKNSRPTL